MKKILALSLAASMVYSMGATAFAAEHFEEVGTIYVDTETDGDHGMHTDSSNEVKLVDGSSPTADKIAWGKKAYFPIYVGVPTGAGGALVGLFDGANGGEETSAYSMSGASIVTKASDADDIKVKIDWEDKELIEGVEVIKMKAYTGFGNTTSKDIGYFVAVEIIEKNTLDFESVSGEIKITKKDHTVRNGTGTVSYSYEDSFDVHFDIGYDYADDNKLSGNKIYSFGSYLSLDDDYELELEGEAGTFTFDSRAQEDVVLGIDVDYSSDLNKLFGIDNYVYINGNGGSVSLVGTMLLNATEDQFLYKVIPNEDGTEYKEGTYDLTLGLMEDCYDDSEDAFVFPTRRMGQYIISDKEIDVEKVVVAKEEADAAAKELADAAEPTEPTEPTEPIVPDDAIVVVPDNGITVNPGTGAIA